jgi:hypothetical protein
MSAEVNEEMRNSVGNIQNLIKIGMKIIGNTENKNHNDLAIADN